MATHTPPLLGLIGAGRAGRAMARSFLTSGSFVLGPVHTRSAGSAAAAIKAIGSGFVADAPGDFASCAAILIATPDQAIADAAAWLRDAPLKPGTMIFHSSGAQSSALFDDLKDRGMVTGSLHPMQSFAGAQTDTLSGIYCALEGMDAFIATMTSVVRAAGAKPVVISKESKPLYHAGAVLASNFLPVLVDAAERCLIAANIAPADAHAMLSPIIQGTGKNIAQLGPAKALTGPAARGDQDTIEMHEAALRAFDPALADLYAALTARAVALARSRQTGE